jgi:tetratricopeptide (TPR) repeat protein
MDKKKIWLIIFLALCGCVLLAYGFHGTKDSNATDYNELRLAHPDFIEFIGDIEKKEQRFAEYETPEGAFLSIGMAWKSLADRTREVGHYKKAMEYFDFGFTESGDSVPLFLINSGNMAVHMKDYELAESYYLRALEMGKNTESTYLRLADLYYYNMKKDPKEIIQLLDKAIERIVGAHNSRAFKEKLLRELEGAQ